MNQSVATRIPFNIELFVYIFVKKNAFGALGISKMLLQLSRGLE